MVQRISVFSKNMTHKMHSKQKQKAALQMEIS